jgi:branched-chain amino acid transport system substrate-binding protein
LPQANKTDTNAVFGYAAAATLVEVLLRCGDDLIRANVMKQAASLKDVRIAMLLDGLTINTGPDDFFPIEQMQLMRFDGQAWHLSGELINGEVGSARHD